MRRIKPDWQAYLHVLREREIALIFRRLPPAAFEQGLELGAGDGFQSGLLARYVRQLVVTDYRDGVATHLDRPGVSYRTCDAERVAETFQPAQFDLVYSSNMLEHLPNPQRALMGIGRVLRDDGIGIHVIPSPFWKLCHVTGFYPNAVLSRLDRWSAHRTVQVEAASRASAWDNNPKSATPQHGYLRRLVAPTPHGVSANNLAEFRAFSPDRWRREFTQAGFRVAALLRGPVSSGYGFGLDRMRHRLERLGLASEYIYVTVKTGQTHPYLAAFER